jgi:hypothetical protein
MSACSLLFICFFCFVDLVGIEAGEGCSALCCPQAPQLIIHAKPVRMKALAQDFFLNIYICWV